MKEVNSNVSEETQALIDKVKEIYLDNPDNFTRPWFSWANAMFAEFILELNDISIWKN